LSWSRRELSIMAIHRSILRNFFFFCFSKKKIDLIFKQNTKRKNHSEKVENRDFKTGTFFRPRWGVWVLKGLKVLHCMRESFAYRNSLTSLVLEIFCSYQWNIISPSDHQLCSFAVKIKSLLKIAVSGVGLAFHSTPYLIPCVIGTLSTFKFCSSANRSGSAAYLVMTSIVNLFKVPSLYCGKRDDRFHNLVLP